MSRPQSENEAEGFFDRFLAKRNQELAERLEEREWRRRMVLASRRIQEVHESLDDDLTDVRGLKAHVESARPEMERLEESLAASRDVFEKLHFMLERHTELMNERVGVVQEEVDRSSQDVERIQQLEEDVARKDAALGELVTQLTEQREALDRARERTGELEEATRTAFLREEQQRLAKEELEAAATRFEEQIDGLHQLLAEFQEETAADRAREAEHAARVLDLEGRIEDLERLRLEAEERARSLAEAAEALEAAHARERAAWASQDEGRRDRIEELEAQVAELTEARESLEARLRDSEIKRLEAETKGQQELTDFADHSRQRQRELEARLKSREQEIRALQGENELLEQRIANLTQRVEEFDDLQEAMRASRLDIEERTSKLLELMRGEEAAAAAPVDDAVAAEVEAVESLPELPTLPEPLQPLEAADTASVPEGDLEPSPGAEEPHPG